MEVKQQPNSSSSGHLFKKTSKHGISKRGVLFICLVFNITSPAGGYVKTRLSRETFFHVAFAEQEEEN